MFSFDAAKVPYFCVQTRVNIVHTVLHIDGWSNSSIWIMPGLNCCCRIEKENLSKQFKLGRLVAM